MALTRLNSQVPEATLRRGWRKRKQVLRVWGTQAKKRESRVHVGCSLQTHVLIRPESLVLSPLVPRLVEEVSTRHPLFQQHQMCSKAIQGAGSDRWGQLWNPSLPLDTTTFSDWAGQLGSPGPGLRFSSNQSNLTGTGRDCWLISSK